MNDREKIEKALLEEKQVKAELRAICAWLIAIAFAAFSLLLLNRDDVDGGAAVSLFTFGAIAATLFYIYPKISVISVGSYVFELNNVQVRTEIAVCNLEWNLKRIYRLHLSSEVRAAFDELEMGNKKRYSNELFMSRLASLIITFDRMGAFEEVRDEIRFSVDEVVNKIQELTLKGSLKNRILTRDELIEAMRERIDALNKEPSEKNLLEAKWISKRIEEIVGIEEIISKMPGYCIKENPSA